MYVVVQPHPCSWGSMLTTGYAVRARCAAPAAPPEFKSPDAFGVRYGLGVIAAGSTSGTSCIYASCPAGMVPMPIGSDVCQRAAAVAGRPYGGNLTLYAMPYGCVWYSTGGSFYFNTAFNTADRSSHHPSAQPVCAGAPCFSTAAISTEGKYVFARACVLRFVCAA
jgi:hypothetical protein